MSTQELEAKLADALSEIDLLKNRIERLEQKLSTGPKVGGLQTQGMTLSAAPKDRK